MTSDLRVLITEKLTVYRNKRLEFTTEEVGRLRYVTAVDGGLKHFPSVAWFAHPWVRLCRRARHSFIGGERGWRLIMRVEHLQKGGWGMDWYGACAKSTSLRWEVWMRCARRMRVGTGTWSGVGGWPRSYSVCYCIGYGIENMRLDRLWNRLLLWLIFVLFLLHLFPLHRLWKTKYKFMKLDRLWNRVGLYKVMRSFKESP